MYCRYCGKELKQNARFCTYCGKEQLKTKPAAADAAVPPVNTQPVNVPPVKTQQVNVRPVDPAPVKTVAAPEWKANAAALAKERMAAGKERMAAGKEHMAAGKEKVSAAGIKGMRLVLIGLACAMCVTAGIILLLDPYSFISIAGI